MRHRLICAAVCALAFISSCMTISAADIYEDNFSSYANFDPGIDNWIFRGIGGEIVDGKYMFTGLTQTQSEYLDIYPDYTMAIVRGWKAGPNLAVKATMKSCPHKYDVFKPEDNNTQKMGIVVLDREFVRKKRTPMDTPFLELTLNRTPDGKHSIFFGYCGKPDIQTTDNLSSESSDWKENVDYTLEISLKGDLATGAVMENGKMIFSKTMQSQKFPEIFARTYPGFSNRRMTGELSWFKADNLNSFAPTVMTKPLEIPYTWNSSLGAEPVLVEDGKVINFAKIYGGYGKGQTVTISTKIDASENGEYALNAKADWFWKLSVNGKQVTPDQYFKKGFGHNYFYAVFPLKKGSNQLELTVKTGSGGWSASLSTPTAQQIREMQLKENIYGSGKLSWNLDRIIDDINNLKRHDIYLSSLEDGIVELRKTLPADLNSREINRYDTQLDQAFATVYDGYRCTELQNAIQELDALNADTAKLDELEKLLPAIIKQVSEDKNIDANASRAQQLIDACKSEIDGFAEGVTRGGSFGRFGWTTSDKLGAYSSGDGLLANQVLASGAIARQYVNSRENEKENYLVRFNFIGEKDPEMENAISCLSTIGENVDIEFGYLPGMFYSGSTPEQVKVKEINWIHKKHSYNDAFLMDACLVAPSLLVESAYKKFELSDSPTESFERIGYRQAGGKIFSGEASADGTIYDLEKNGALGSNWIMLWNGKNSTTDLNGHVGNIPLQIIFQHQPLSITRQKDKLVFMFRQGGALWLNTPYGVRIQPTGNWRGNLPPEAVAKADFFGRTALAYPQDVREFYRYDKDNKQVEIINHYYFREFTDDWNTKPLEIAALPPILSLMTDKGFDALLPENLKDLDYPTLYGPLRGVEGNQISYLLAVPQIPQVIVPANTSADPHQVSLMNRHAMDDIEGSRFRLYDEAMCRSWYPQNLPQGAALRKWQYLTPAFQDYLKEMFTYGMTAANGYRSNRMLRSLIEPYSGEKYFYSFSIKSKDPGDVGVFGDRGYGVGLHLNLLEKWSTITNRYDLLRQIWSDSRPLSSPEASHDGQYLTIDKMRGYYKNVHDWAWMESGSNDNGDNGPVVDCSQAPFLGHCSYFRMAQKIGNSQDIALGAYHLAKGQLSLIARLASKDYCHENGLLGPDNINVGFRECLTPDCFANSSMLNNRTAPYFSSYICTLFYASGDTDDFDVYFPYAKYTWNTVKEYNKTFERYFPNSDVDVQHSVSGLLISRLMFLLLAGESIDTIQKLYDINDKKLIFYNRNYNERVNLPLLLSGGCPFVLTDFYPLELPRVCFTPEEKTLIITLKNISSIQDIQGLSSIKPKSIMANENKAEWSYNEKTNRLEIKTPTGRNVTLRIQYDRIDPNHFTPLQTPKPDFECSGFIHIPSPDVFQRVK